MLNRELKQCAFCGEELKAPFLDYGSLPLANAFRPDKEKQPLYPLSLKYCSSCHLVQLAHWVNPEKLYTEYLYQSAISQSFRTYFEKYAQDLKNRFAVTESKLTIDIGSNDGILLHFLQQAGFRAIGVEASRNLAKQANRQGLETVQAFFNLETAEKLRSDYGEADMITLNNVFDLMPNSCDTIEALKVLLKDDGILIIEFPHLLSFIEKKLFDTVYHEHLFYISLTAIKKLLEKKGLFVSDTLETESHGGSLRLFIQKQKASAQTNPKVEAILKREKESGLLAEKTYQDFAEAIGKHIAELKAFLKQIKANGQSVAAYGAPSKATTLIHLCGWSHQEIDFVIDDNPLKQNRYVPGTDIPIVPSDPEQINKTDVFLIFAWNFAEEIIALLKENGFQGSFLIPLPEIVFKEGN